MVKDGFWLCVYVIFGTQGRLPSIEHVVCVVFLGLWWTQSPSCIHMCGHRGALPLQELSATIQKCQPQTLVDFMNFFSPETIFLCTCLSNRSPQSHPITQNGKKGTDPFLMHSSRPPPCLKFTQCRPSEPLHISLFFVISIYSLVQYSSAPSSSETHLCKRE